MVWNFIYVPKVRSFTPDNLHLGVAVKPDFKKNTSDISLTFTSLLYGNGPGGLRQIRTRNLTNEETGKIY